jgi:hypothetical protein
MHESEAFVQGFHLVEKTKMKEIILSKQRQDNIFLWTFVKRNTANSINSVIPQMQLAKLLW